MTSMLKGIAASSGVAVAKAYLLVQPDLSFETVTVENIENEEARLDAALAAAQSELQIIKDKAVDSLGEEAAAVFDAHMMVLADPDMTAQIKATIESKKVNAEAALKEITDMFIAIFEGMEDNAYMQERAADIKDVTKRVMANLLGVKLPSPALINERSARSCVRNIASPLLESEIRKARQPKNGFISSGKSKYGNVLSPPMSIVRTTTGLPFMPSSTALYASY